MKTKIFILLSVILSLLGIQELNAQDTLWTRKVNSESRGYFSNDGTKVLISHYNDSSQYVTCLLTADSGRVMWTNDSVKLPGDLISPDSLTFLSVGGSDSSPVMLIRRLSDGSIIKRLDSIIFKNYPRPLPYHWKTKSYAFSRDGRYLFVLTSDEFYQGPKKTEINYIYKIDLSNDELVSLKKDNSVNEILMKPDENILLIFKDSLKYIGFYDTDSLNLQKYYRDDAWGIFQISRSGRYITSIHEFGNIYTWDTQVDSIIKKKQIDSLYLESFHYTSNDSLIVLLAVINKSYKFVVYNVFTSQIINSWYWQVPPIEIIKRFDLSPDDSKLLVNGYSRSIYMYDLTLQPTAKKDDIHPEAIIRINPNPALGNVVVEFDSQMYDNAKILLYDEDGGFVMNIKEGNLNSGMNTITFSTKNLSNGIYFIRVTGGSINQSSKLIILK